MAYSIQQTFRRNVLVLALALGALVAVQVLVFAYFQLRADQKRELANQALMLSGQIKIIHGQSTAPLEPILRQAIVNPRLALACVSDAQGKSLAVIDGYAAVRLGIAATRLGTACKYFQNPANRRQALVVHVPISDPALPKSAGTLMLVGATSSIYEHFGARLFSFFSIVMVFAGLCYWQGQRLIKYLIKPMRQIATTAQRVSLYKDYSLRVTTGALTDVPHEIELLIDSFNTMLKEVEDRDARLTRKTGELEKSKQLTESANIAKSQFMANISHELRTPLNAIIGFSTILETQRFGPLGHEKYAEYVKDIRDSGRHLLDIINDILDLSKAEAGKLSVKFEILQLSKLVEKALNIIAGQAQDAKVDIYTDIPDGLPKIVADRVRLMQILLNLLSNAVKFTPAGGKAIVRARAEVGKSNVHFFTIEVQDSGIGMTEDEIRNAFVSFNQVDAGLNRKFEGAGLGLPLTKRLVELHHGKIKIESIKGHGTTVTVRLTSDPALLD